MLEAEDGLGYHASGRSAALFEETYGQPSTMALNRASQEYHMTANGGVLSPRGLMLIWGQPRTKAPFAEDLARHADAAVSLGGGARHGADPRHQGVVTQVGYDAEAWDIDTDRLIQNFAREARGNGAAS